MKTRSTVLMCVGFLIVTPGCPVMQPGSEAVLTIESECDRSPGAAAGRFEDLSGFEHFTFERMTVMCFNPVVGSVYRADIVANDAGDFVFNASLVVEGDAEVDECLEDSGRVGPCLIESPLPQRTLDAGEAATLSEALSCVVIFDEPADECRIIASDPCMLNVFTWDSLTINDFPCAASFVSSGPLLDLLEQLAR